MAGFAPSWVTLSLHMTNSTHSIVEIGLQTNSKPKLAICLFFEHCVLFFNFTIFLTNHKKRQLCPAAVVNISLPWNGTLKRCCDLCGPISLPLLDHLGKSQPKKISRGVPKWAKNEKQNQFLGRASWPLLAILDHFSPLWSLLAATSHLWPLLVVSQKSRSRPSLV